MAKMKSYWTCSNCHNEVEDTFDACWSCQHDRYGNPRVDLTEGVTIDDISERQMLSEKYKDQHCAVCRKRLTYVGTKKFHEGILFGGTYDPGALFQRLVVLEMYVCPQCRRVEFFDFNQS